VGVESNCSERRVEKLIIKHVTGGPKNKETLEKLCKEDDKSASASRVGDAIDRLEAGGVIERVKGNRKEKPYALKGAGQLEIHYDPEIEPTEA
jgi:hypothetical protein